MSDPRLFLDFGTGYCKAAVCSRGGIPRPLTIGQAVRQGGDPHMVRTALHIDDQGTVAFGEAAMEAATSDRRVPFDTIKNAFIDAEQECELDEPMPQEYNPTPLALTHRQATMLFLAFFTQAALRAGAGLPTDVLRSIGMPVFPAPKAAWVSAALSDGLRRAHALAAHFGDRLFRSISLADALSVLDAGDENPRVIANPATVVEPVAAVAAQLLHWTAPDQEGTPGATLVVDVGAGTSDMAMFVKGEVDGLVAFRHVAHSKRSVPKAGKAIDHAVVSHLAACSSTERDRRVLEAELLREAGGQPIKEELFEHRHVTRRSAETSLSAFLNSKPLREVVDEIQLSFDNMLRAVDRSFFARILPVRLSGGGASLPFLGNLAQQRFLHGRQDEPMTEVKLVRASDRPQWYNHDRYARLYRIVHGKFHRLAVALGGAYYCSTSHSWLRLDDDITYLARRKGPTRAP